LISVEPEVKIYSYLTIFVGQFRVEAKNVRKATYSLIPTLFISKMLTLVKIM